ncbi:hypothetical protein [Nocardia puris]|uniref:hypothetical protein n=1 Tax=Nocardia puris TaxID=208602 RepID=UPI0011BFC189|nr:hypothetical protein [Nocardia puris]
MAKTDRYEIGVPSSLAAASLLVVASIALMGCSSGIVTPSSVETSSPPASTTLPVTCVDRTTVPEWRNADEKYLTPKMAEMPLPTGTCLSDVDINELTSQPGMVVVAVDLNVPTSTHVDDLRAAATDIARFLKRTELAPRIAIVDISNLGFTRTPYEDLLTDENFQNNRWDGTLSRDEELATWVIVPRP